MNKYTMRGLLLDAIDGQRIGVVLPNVEEIGHALGMVEEGPWISRISRVNGAERVQLEGGGQIRFATPRAMNRLRNFTMDAAFLDQGCDTIEVQQAIAPSMATTGGEIHRA